LINNAYRGSTGPPGSLGSSAGAVVISRGIQRFGTERKKGLWAAIIELLYSTKYFMSTKTEFERIAPLNKNGLEDPASSNPNLSFRDDRA
jgi:hypothetical protein